MAKKKLTLEDVLVPKDEIPYEVPENWCWVKYDTVMENLSSSTKKIKQKEYLQDGLYPVIDQGSSLIGGYTNDEELLYDGDLPVIIFGDHTRCVKYVDFRFAQGADGVKVLKTKGDMDTKYIYYLMLNLELPNKGYSRHYKFLREAKFQIPPLAEQVRIVNRIESLFDKVDKASELVDEARDGFEKRRAAILERAFCGELTKKWREENGVSDEWYGGIFEDLCVLKRGYDLPSYNRVSGEYSLVSSSGINDTHNEYKVKGPGITVGRSGSVGKVFYVEGDFWPLNTTLYVQNFKENDSKYVYYYLSNFNFKPYSSSTAVPTLNRNNFKNVLTKIPSLDEQKEIVRILESVLSKEKEVDEISDIKENIDIIKKSILAKVFRGEVGSNDINEESSIELLKNLI